MSQGNDSDRPNAGDAGAPEGQQPPAPDAGQQQPIDAAPESPDAPGGNGGEGEAPEVQLQNLRQELENAQHEQKTADSKIQRIEAQIAALTQLIADFEKITRDYEKEHPALAETQTRYGDFKSYQKTCLDHVLGEEAAQQVRAEVKQEIELLDAQEKKVKRAKEALDALKKKKTEDEKKRDDMKKTFEMWKKPIISIKERFGKLEAAMREVKAAHDAGDYAIAYWLLTSEAKFSGLLGDQPEVISPGELEEALKYNWKQYRDAIYEFQTLDGQVKGAEKALQTNEALLADMKKKLDATIHARLSKIKPKPNEAKQELEHA